MPSDLQQIHSNQTWHQIQPQRDLSNFLVGVQAPASQQPDLLQKALPLSILQVGYCVSYIHWAVQNTKQHPVLFMPVVITLSAFFFLIYQGKRTSISGIEQGTHNALATRLQMHEFSRPDTHSQRCIFTSWYTFIAMHFHVLIHMHSNAFSRPDTHSQQCIFTPWYTFTAMHFDVLIHIHSNAFSRPETHAQQCIFTSWYTCTAMRFLVLRHMHSNAFSRPDTHSRQWTLTSWHTFTAMHFDILIHIHSNAFWRPDTHAQQCILTSWYTFTATIAAQAI